MLVEVFCCFNCGMHADGLNRDLQVQLAQTIGIGQFDSLQVFS